MTRTILAAALGLAAAQATMADVTLKSTTTGQGIGMSGTMTGTTYIKGDRMRVESVTGSKTATSIYDIGAQKMYVINDKKKEVEVWDMASVGQEMSKAVSTDSIQATIKPNGQTKTVAGRNAEGYDLHIVVPTVLGGPGGIQMTMVLTGVSWIAKGAPGSEDYAAFYRGAAEKGWIFSDPRAAKGSPGQAKAMARMYTEFAAIGGLPLETQMDIKGEGGGIMGAMMSKLGLSMTTVTDSVDTAPLADALFQVPADYAVKQR